MRSTNNTSKQHFYNNISKYHSKVSRHSHFCFLTFISNTYWNCQKWKSLKMRSSLLLGFKIQRYSIQNNRSTSSQSVLFLNLPWLIEVTLPDYSKKEFTLTIQIRNPQLPCPAFNAIFEQDKVYSGPWLVESISAIWK